MRCLICFIIVTSFQLNQAQARTWLCEEYGYCGGYGGGRSSSSPAQPTANSSISINPAAVPTHDTYGVDALYFKGTFDLAIVKGLGRVGAALSPTNNEETFFGVPAIESDEELFDRKFLTEKYKSEKVTLATAFNLFKSQSSGLRKFELNLGVAGKYNKLSYLTTGGGGLSGVAGPFTFGYSAYSDSHFEKKNPVYGQMEDFEEIFSIETVSIGIFLNSLAIDYSELRVNSLLNPSKVALTTASLILKKAIISISLRRELSNRLVYNYELEVLEFKKEKSSAFAGLQMTVTDTIRVGVFYNYYLLNELSLGATAFF